MGRYIDLSKVIDFEPFTQEVLGILEDEDVISEFSDRLDKDFVDEFFKEYCSDADAQIIRNSLDKYFPKCD